MKPFVTQIRFYTDSNKDEKQKVGNDFFQFRSNRMSKNELTSSKCQNCRCSVVLGNKSGVKT